MTQICAAFHFCSYLEELHDINNNVSFRCSVLPTLELCMFRIHLQFIHISSLSCPPSLLTLRRSLTFWSVAITEACGMMDLWNFRTESLVLPRVGKAIFSKSNHHDFLYESCTWAIPRAVRYKREQWSGSWLAPRTRQFCHDLLCYLPKPSFCAMFSFLLITRSYCLKCLCEERLFSLSRKNNEVLKRVAYKNWTSSQRCFVISAHCPMIFLI